MSRWSDLPIVALASPSTPSALITAVSVRGSVPTISAGAWSPFSNDTEMRPPSPASSTTWSLVRISPFSLRMIPEPDPLAGWPSASPATLILTTEGSTSAATCSTEPSGAGLSPESTTGIDAGGARAAGRGRLVGAPLLPGGGTGQAGTAPQHEGANKHGARDQPAAPRAARGRLAVGSGSEE